MKPIRFVPVILTILLLFTSCSAADDKSAQASAPVTQERVEASETEPIPSGFSEAAVGTSSDMTELPAVETEPAETEPSETEPAVETEPAETEPAETEPAETELAETEPSETEPAETEPIETVPATTEFEADLQDYSGTVENNVYTNKNMNLRCEAPADWSFYSREEIARYISNESGGVVEMHMKDESGDRSVGIDLYLLDDLGLFDEEVKLLIRSIEPTPTSCFPEKLYLLMRSSYERVPARIQYHIELEHFEAIQCDFCGETISCLKMEYRSAYFENWYYSIWIRLRGNAAACLTLMFPTEADEEFQALLDCFSKLN